MKHIAVIMIACLAFLPQSMLAQINLNDSLIGKDGLDNEWHGVYSYMRHAMNFSTAIPQEKVYLHFDNTGYFKGETMWFKAYVVRADNGKPTDISKVLYVELVTPGGDVINTHKLRVENGEANGEFKLDTLYATGFYEVRAYTRYMTNWGNGACFSRTFPIFQSPKVEGDYSQLVLDKNTYKLRMPNYREAAPKPSIHFYPEGGNLIEDVPARVAFTAIDKEGRNFEAKGVLLDAEKNPIQAVVTYGKGRGYFDVTPTDEPMYLQLTSNVTGVKHEFELPEARPQGISLILDALHDDAVTATLRASRVMEGRLLGYSLMQGGRIILCDTIRAKKEQAIKFVRKDLPAGVNQLTVFDASGHIQAERLFFICPQRSPSDSILISTTNDRIVPCGKVKVNIQTQPNARLSFSAMDIATLPNGKEGNALTWMLLGSEVKGYIPHPEYYFEADDRQHRIDADMLMMVQGWRRYDWSLMEGNSNFARIQFVEDSLYLHGTLSSKSKHKPVDGVKLEVWLYTRTGQWVAGTTTTDSVGHYAFRMPDLIGDWRLLMKTSKDSLYQDYRVCIDRNFSPMTRWLSPYETEYLSPVLPNLFQNVPDSMYEDLKFLRLAKRENILPNVKVKAYRRIFDNARASWESESQGQHWASIFYNVSKEAEEIYDRGEQVPGLYEWLYNRNPLFGGHGENNILPTQESSNILKYKDKTIVDNTVDDSGMPFGNGIQPKLAGYNIGMKDNELQFGSVTPSEYTYVPTERLPARLWRDGLGYKNRPIVWILNNSYWNITSLYDYNIGTTTVLESSLDIEPVFIDEVKSVYISEKPFAYMRYVQGDGLFARNPVTVFVYTHSTFNRKVKGLRRTYYQGFNSPETFEMDDYSVIPPMEDYRRTIFWAPEVKADAQGKASVEFYNNSSCRQLYISCEGITPEGRFLTNE